MQAAAAAAFAGLASRCQDTKLIVIGPQSLSAGVNPGSLVSAAGISTACAVSANVLGSRAIQPALESWIADAMAPWAIAPTGIILGCPNQVNATTARFSHSVSGDNYIRAGARRLQAEELTFEITPVVRGELFQSTAEILFMNGTAGIRRNSGGEVTVGLPSTGNTANVDNASYVCIGGLNGLELNGPWTGPISEVVTYNVGIDVESRNAIERSQRDFYGIK